MAIYVTRPSIPPLEEFMEVIRPIFDSHILTNMGPIYQKFEKELRDYLDVPHISLFVNGHTALEMAIRQMELPAGGEVITTPFTFVSTTHAIVQNNLIPVFCDIRISDFTIDPDCIERLITEKTVAIIPVHVYGHVCDVEKIEEVAQRYNLKVIYDAAHAFGVTYKGRGIGNFGDISMFSFHATKVFNSIEGGALTFGDVNRQKRFYELKNFGIHGEEDVVSVGGNGKMDEFRAAMGLCNLTRLEEGIQSRKRIYEHYVNRLKNVDGVCICGSQEHVESNYAYFPVCFCEDVFGKSRDDVYRELHNRQIYARKYFYPAVNELQCYKDKYWRQDTPIAHKISRSILTLPIYEGLSLENVDMICDVILS